MLRSFGSRALTVGILAITASGVPGSAGCSITKPTEVVPGALSQIEVPKNLAAIRVQVKVEGSVKYDENRTVQNGVVFLPATLGVVSGGSTAQTVTVIVAGYNNDSVLNQEGELNNGTSIISEVGTTPNSSPSVRRTSVLTYVNQRTLFLPMNLSYACWGAGCTPSAPETTTCKANACGSSSVDSSTLVDFDPSLVDGTQDCFSPGKCFSPVTTAVPVDAKNCIYEVPPDQVSGFGLNVRILYQDLKLVPNPATKTSIPETVPTSEQEILNEEPMAALSEGYGIPDPAKPERFQLASGLCDLVHSLDSPPAKIPASGVYHAISAVQVSTACPSKLPLLPICAAEQNVPALGADGGPTTDLVCNQPITLDPVPSAIYMVMDNSSIMSGAFGPQGYATAMGLSLSNPVFKRTYVAFDFLDHLGTTTTPNECTAGSTTYTSLAPFAQSGAKNMEFTLANVGQPTVANFLGSVTPPDPGPDGGVPPGGYAPLYLQAAMRSDVGVYKHLQDFTTGLQESPAVAAAMFFVNRIPDSTGLGDAGDLKGPDNLVTSPAAACSGLVPPLPSGTPCTVPGGVDCQPALDTAGDTSAQAALEQQIIAADKLGLQSYFVILNNSIYQAGTPLKFFQDIQTYVKTQGVTTMQVLDATAPRSQIGSILGTFSNVVTPLGTCLYEAPPGVGPSAKVVFTIPVPTQFNPQAPAPLNVSYNANCNATNQTSQDGWNLEGSPGGIQHLRICGTSCTDLRASVLGVAAATLTGGGDGGTGGVSDAGAASIPEVPVTVTVPCTDAGM